MRALLPPLVFILFAGSPLYNPAFRAGLPALHPVLFAGLPALHPVLFAGLPALQPGDPFFKRGRSENFFCGRATYFLWKGEESGMPELLIFGCRSMDTGRRPLCGCFVLPPARPEKAKPFQAGQSPCTKHPQIVRLRLHEPKKVFEGSKGRFFKNAPWQGVGRSPTKTDAAFSVKRGEKGA